MNTLETKRLLLRTLTTNDSERIEELAGDYDVAKSTLNIPHPYPKGSAKQFIDSIHSAEENNKVVMFAITKKESQQLIGLINLNLATPYRRGELAYWIGKQYWGKGYGTEATKELLEYGFNHLGLIGTYIMCLTTKREFVRSIYRRNSSGIHSFI